MRGKATCKPCLNNGDECDYSETPREDNVMDQEKMREKNVEDS